MVRYEYTCFPKIKSIPDIKLYKGRKNVKPPVCAEAYLKKVNSASKGSLSFAALLPRIFF